MWYSLARTKDHTNENNDPSERRSWRRAYPSLRQAMVALHADTGRVLAHAAWDVRKLGKIFRVLALPPQKQHEATAQSPMAAAA